MAVEDVSKMQVYIIIKINLGHFLQVSYPFGDTECIAKARLPAAVRELEPALLPETPELRVWRKSSLCTAMLPDIYKVSSNPLRPATVNIFSNLFYIHFLTF